jgi:hypothetical protein
MKFSREFVQAIHNTWQAIGSDVLESYASCSEEPDNEAVVEGCIDADHIVTYGGPNGRAAQAEFRARVREIGYTPAIRLACRSLPCPLV